MHVFFGAKNSKMERLDSGRFPGVVDIMVAALATPAGVLRRHCTRALAAALGALAGARALAALAPEPAAAKRAPCVPNATYDKVGWADGGLRPGQKPLKFIHVTKTGGTFLAELAAKHGFGWGYLDCTYGAQHTPFPWKPAALKRRYDWFLVARNPCARIQSELHWMRDHGVGRDEVHVECGGQDKGRRGPRPVACDAAAARFIQSRGPDRYVIDGGYHGATGADHHFLEMSTYLPHLVDPRLRSTYSAGEDAGVVIHVVRMEHLAEDFNGLMERYAMPLRVQHQHPNLQALGRTKLAPHPSRSAASQPVDPALRDAIVAAYGGDMRNFNYTTCFGVPWEDFVRGAGAVAPGG